MRDVVVMDRVEELLKERGISYYQLSKMTGIPQSTLAMYRQRSNPTFLNMEKIALALNVSLDEFRTLGEKRE